MDRQTIINNVISTVIGVVLGFGIENFRTATPFQWLLISILLILFLFLYVVAGPLKYLLKSRGSYDIAGQWDSQWTYVKKGVGDVVVNEIVEINQLGRHIKGRAESVRIVGDHPFQSLRWEIHANILEGGVLEGNWRNTEKGKNYHGVIQGRIHSSGKTVEVLWIGVENDGIRSGSAVWKRKL